MGTRSTVSEQWAAFISGTSFKDLPATATEEAKLRVLDCLATALAARSLPVPAVSLKFVQTGSGKATIFGHHQRVSAIDAGFVNGTLVNGTTHDDFLYKSHPGAVVIPAALAVAEEEGSCGEEILASIVAGYEIVARAYMGAPGMLPKFRASGVAGTIGATATAGKLQRLSEAELVSALGCSAVFASGFGEGFLTGTMDVKLNVGWACRSGISAASLARFGATASPTAYEGKSGYFTAFGGNAEHAAEATRGLGERYLIEEVSYKERPVCFFVQTPVHLAHQFAQDHKIDPNQIQSVSVRAPEATYTNPGFKNLPPYGTPLQARISAKFTVAAALLGRPIHEYGFYGNIADPEILAFGEKIELIENAEDQQRVYLEIIYDGTTYHVEAVEAETLRPTPDKIIAKFRRLATDFLKARTDDVLDTVLNLDRLKDIRKLTDALRAEG